MKGPGSGMGSSPPGGTLLAVEHVNAGYGRLPVLWDVSLELTAGEVVALVGANGAGKTTLLRVISGLLAPASGSVRLGGNDVTGASPERICGFGLAHVPEGRQLFHGLTTRENLLMGGYRQRGSANLEAVLTLFPRLRERLGQVAATLSGGEQQMCAIGRGLMSGPRVLLIDELSLGLAPLIKKQLFATLRDIAGQGTAILLVEQDMKGAFSVATRGYVLELGKIVAAGTSAQLRDSEHVSAAYFGDFARTIRDPKGS